VGTLVGQPNKGLQAMFVMMNAARLGVGNQSLGLTEVAYQNAWSPRTACRCALSGPKAPDKPADPIIVHPDVRRMLLTAKPLPKAPARCTYTALQLDKALKTDDEERKEADAEVALLTPSSRPSSPTTAGSPPRTACRSSAATASSTSGAWSSSCATRAST
jgi:alkylation response protein AidB-like acyl-CoA dehydrogenase